MTDDTCCRCNIVY